MNRGGANRQTNVSREARRELEVRLAVERVNSIEDDLGNIRIQRQT